MFKKILMVIAIMLITFMVGNSEDDFYYSNNQQYQLTAMEDKVVIGFKPTGFGDFSSIIAAYPAIVDSVEPQRIGYRFFVFDVDSAADLESLIQELNADTLIEIALPAFENEFGVLEAFNNNIVVKPKDWLSQTEYDSLLDYYNVVETGTSPTRPNLRYVTVTDSTSLTVLETANRLYEESGIEFSHPMFCARDYQYFYTPVDSLYRHQWYLYNEVYFDYEEIYAAHINMEKAWDITAGDPEVIIAMFDEAFSNHPDLKDGAFIDSLDVVGSDRYRPSLDTNCYPAYCDSCGHGYAVTGIIFGHHDHKGIAGIAPDCKLIFIKNSDDYGYIPTNDSALAEGLVHAARMGANIISNSWGAFFYAPTDDMVYALNYITEPSFAGYSCVVIFAAGNYWPYGIDVAYPANMPQTLAVGAVDSMSFKWYYSSWGETLDLVAPSSELIKPPLGELPATTGSIMTFDQPGDSGFTPHYYEPPYPWYTFSMDPEHFILIPDSIGYEYFSGFCGTSVSCPQVAGIAALIMARRPDLADSNYTIYNILKHSCVDQAGNPDYDYPGWDPYYGFGRADALRALLAVSRGDANNDGNINILDFNYLFAYLYQGGPAPEPDVLMGDADCDCYHNDTPDIACVNLLDMTYLIDSLYHEGPAPGICFKYND